MHVALELMAVAAGIALIVGGAEAFAQHLSVAAVRLRVSAFALAILLAGAEPEELATTVTASLRHAPGVALGDVIGANIAICLVALGVGAVLAPLPFGSSVLRYGVLGLLLAGVAAAVAWDGHLGRSQGLLLIGLYVGYVGVIWIVERRPPVLGETAELAEAAGEATGGRIGRELGFVVVGVAVMAIGALLAVEGVRHLSHVESTQTRLGLVLVGFATAFELVVLAWSAARRGISEAVVAGVIGSFAYNVTMSLGAGALARPLRMSDPGQLHGPWVAMVAALVGALILAFPRRRLERPAGWLLVAAYPLVALTVLAR
jgi:cation:H+ antiporter